jgi:hypothetical protein
MHGRGEAYVNQFSTERQQRRKQLDWLATTPTNTYSYRILMQLINLDGPLFMLLRFTAGSAASRYIRNQC